jgi:hypothetical protein
LQCSNAIRPLPDVEAGCDYWEQKQIGDLIDVVDTGHGDFYLREGEITRPSGTSSSISYCSQRSWRRRSTAYVDCAA